MLSIIVLVSVLLQISSSFDIYDDNKADQILSKGKTDYCCQTHGNKQAVREASSEELKYYSSSRGSSSFGSRFGKRASGTMLKFFNMNSYLDDSNVVSLESIESQTNRSTEFRKKNYESTQKFVTDSNLNNFLLPNNNNQEALLPINGKVNPGIELKNFTVYSGLNSLELDNLEPFTNDRSEDFNNTAAVKVKNTFVPRMGKRASGTMRIIFNINSYLDDSHVVSLESIESQTNRSTFRKKNDESTQKFGTDSDLNNFLFPNNNDQEVLLPRNGKVNTGSELKNFPVYSDFNSLELDNLEPFTNDSSEDFNNTLGAVSKKIFIPRIGKRASGLWTKVETLYSYLGTLMWFI